MAALGIQMVTEIRKLKHQDLAFDPWEGVVRFFCAFRDLTLQSYRQSESNLVAVGLCGIVGMPLYYFVWHDLFPQPYENLSLRLIGSALCALMVLKAYWPRPLQAYMPVLWYVVLLYALPFFFTYMLLMNDISPVWLVTWLCGLFLLVVVVDWINLIVMLVLGLAAAWIAFTLTADHMIDFDRLYEQLPVIVFALVGGTIFSYRRGSLKLERLETMRALGRNVSRELSTPLRGVTTSTIGLKQYLPVLLQTYDRAAKEKMDVAQIPEDHRRALAHTVERIQSDIGRANTLAHLLSVNTQMAPLNGSTFQICSMSDCVSVALERFPFASQAERYVIQVRSESDFVFYGCEHAMVDILMNVIKAAFVSRGPSPKGDITLSIKAGHPCNRVTISSSTSGVAVRSSIAVFDAFSPLEQQSGTGPGLAYAKDCTEDMGGTLFCHLQAGGFIDFILELPNSRA